MATSACPNDEVLLAVLLDDATTEDLQHVQGCTDCQERLKRAGSELTTLRGAARRAGPALLRTEAVPATIGRYLVVGELGKGGQGRVYRGLHPRLGVEVAIKWSDVELRPGPSGRDALVVEGQLLAQLNHPHLVRVLDLDVHDGRPFLVMEYVRGGDLEERRKNRRVGPQQAATWVAQLADALQEAHAAGVTHQDVKPRNVLVDEADRVRLADFGLARLRQSLAADQEPLGGTLAYMAPEQARREVEKIGPASDVFGLGGVLYFLLTGRAPIQGDNLLVLRQRGCAGEVDFGALAAVGVPKPLAAICRRALAADPLQRYPTAGAMAADLKRWLNRPRSQVLVLAVLAVVLTVALGYFLFWPHAPALQASAIPEGPQPLIEQVERTGRGAMGSLLSASRLSDGDRFKILCDVPRGYAVALFYIDAEGKVQRLNGFSINRGERFDQLVFPKGKGKRTMRGAPGTEMFLVCASRSSLRASEIEALLRKLGRWPTIKGDVFLSLCSDKVRTSDTVRGHEEDRDGTDFSRAWERLDELRLQLRDHCDFFVGVVYGYDG